MPRTRASCAKKLTQEEIRNEVIALQDLGHKRLLLEAGEHPKHNPIEYILESIKTIYSIKHKNGAIRRLNVNIAATTVENYRKLHEAEIGTYQLFQETYNRKAYEELHPKGPKSDYAYHTEAHDRAMEGGIDDVGLGVLFGLDLCRYDFVGLLMHAEHLEAVWGVGPHTISVPRICPADDIDPASFENAVPDDLFLKIVALIRMAVPYTGMIMSTREGQRIRTEALKLGISQISGGSRTSVGGYAIRSVQEMEEKTEQFETNDRRSLDEIVRWLLENHYLPSFCTACYRAGRTGDRFMEWAKDGQHRHVLPGQRHHDDEGVHVRLRLEGNPRGRRARHRQRTPEDPAREDPHRQRKAPDPHRRRRTRLPLLIFRPIDLPINSRGLLRKPRDRTQGEKGPADHIGPQGLFCFWGFFSFLFRGTARSDRARHCSHQWR